MARGTRDLSDQEIQEIRTLYWAGRKCRVIAEQYGVVETSVSGLAWRKPQRGRDLPRVPGEPEVLPPYVQGRHRNTGRVREVKSNATLTASQVLEMRTRYWYGLSIQEELATDYGLAQPSVWFILQRTCYRAVPPFPATEDHPGELACLEQSKRVRYGSIRTMLQDMAEPQHPELETPVDTGTGKLVGPDGQIYEDVRRAEQATGLDRMVIAQHLADGTWTYEPGPSPGFKFANWGTHLVWNDLRW